MNESFSLMDKSSKSFYKNSTWQDKRFGELALRMFTLDILPEKWSNFAFIIITVRNVVAARLCFHRRL